MHGGCYFHHMVLSGVIVVPALSAQIAVCSQIVVVVSTLTLSPLLLTLFYSPCTLFHRVMEMEYEEAAGSINRPRLQSGVDPGMGVGLKKMSSWLL